MKQRPENNPTCKDAADETPQGNEADSPWIIAPVKILKGRGALSNISGRYETRVIEPVDDGWWQEEDAADTGIQTQVTHEIAKTILTRNQSPDLPFDVSLNPYRGCEHGCIYCFARPTHSYLGLSPGLDFETRLFAKINAPDLLRRELAMPSYVPQPIALGVNTDAYQPCERKLKLTRKILQVLQECRHPVALITKSALIERDMDILSEMATDQLVIASITLTTLEHDISRTLEPRAASPTRRLQTIERLAARGIPVYVSIAPVIPFITEQELEKVLAAAIGAGASGAGYTVIRLPWEVSPLFEQWLETHFPERAKRVLNRIRDMRDGKNYDATFGARMRGEGVWADIIHQRFEKAMRRLQLDKGFRFKRLNTSHFKQPLYVPAANRADNEQMDFFN